MLQRKSVADVEVPFDARGQEQCVYWEVQRAAGYHWSQRSDAKNTCLFLFASACSPLFVSWNIYSASAFSKALGSLKKGSARLRGCIGIFEPMPLVDGLADYAQTRYVASHQREHGTTTS